MSLWQKYLQPTRVQDALSMLEQAAGKGRLIAGGTDLLLDIRQGRQSAELVLVDINSIPELTRIEVMEGILVIGAAVPINRIAEHALVRVHAQALAEACSLIGGLQVRNTATLGGNVAHALPAADGSIAMLCLGTQVTIADIQGSHQVPLDEMFLGPGRSALRAGKEMIVDFRMPLKCDGEASAFKRVMNPQGIALPILNFSASVRRSGRRCKALRLVCGPSGSIPQRLTDLEQALVGGEIKEGFMDAITDLISAVPFRSSSHRASSDYRQLLFRELLHDTLLTAWERAEKSEGYSL